MSVVVELDSVSRTFAGAPPVEAVREATLEVAEGDYAAIVRPAPASRPCFTSWDVSIRQPPEAIDCWDGT